MPGYQTDRFVGLSETERTELQCIICRDILKNPVFAKCCLQTYCLDCINQWLIHNNICPFDRQPLDNSQLTRPPRLLINMLGKLKISCCFKDKGCPQVISLDDLDTHTNRCAFNRKQCELCNLESIDGHNCLNELIKLNKLLETKLNTTEIRIDSLEKENENYLQTIRELCLNSNSNHILKISENQMLIDARKHWDSLRIVSKNTPKEMTAQIISIISESVNCRHRLNEICSEIRKQVETRFGGLWMCYSAYDGMASISCTVDNNYFVCLRIQNLKLSVHKVYDEIDFTKISGHLLKSIDSKKQFSIYKTDMNSETIETIKKVVINAFESVDNWTDFVEYIFNTLSKLLNGIWNCIIYKKYLGHFCVIPKTRQYINFYIGELDFAIFQISN